MQPSRIVFALVVASACGKASGGEDHKSVIATAEQRFKAMLGKLDAQGPACTDEASRDFLRVSKRKLAMTLDLMAPREPLDEYLDRTSFDDHALFDFGNKRDPLSSRAKAAKELLARSTVVFVADKLEPWKMDWAFMRYQAGTLHVREVRFDPRGDVTCVKQHAITNSATVTASGEIFPSKEAFDEALKKDLAVQARKLVY